MKINPSFLGYLCGFLILFGYTNRPYQNYPKYRKIVNAEDNYTCQQCGKQPESKMCFTYGCSLLNYEEWHDKNAVNNRHPSICPIKNEIGVIQLPKLTSNGTTMITAPKRACHECEHLVVYCYEDYNTRPLVMHHKNNNPYDNRRHNLETLCKTCNQLAKNTIPKKLEVNEMFFSKKKEKANEENIGEQKVATLEINSDTQVDALILARLAALEDADAKKTKEMNQYKQKIHRLEEWVHLSNGGNQQTTELRKKSNGSDMKNKDTDYIDANTSYECKWKRAAYNEILQKIAGKGTALKKDIQQMICDILIKHQIGKTSCDGYVKLLKRKKKMEDAGQKRYKILI